MKQFFMVALCLRASVRDKSMFGSKLDFWACEKYADEEYSGINLVHSYLFKKNKDQFIAEIKNALGLIRDNDNRRFKRITSHVKHIMFCECAGLAVFLKGDIIQLDIARFDFVQNAIWSRYMLASSLIHEATHSYLFSKGISYNR